MRLSKWILKRILLGIALSSLPFSLIAAGKKPVREEGEYRIYVSGKEIGSERYVLVTSEDSASSNSMVEFRNPGDRSQKVKLESRLETDGRFVPKSYELASDVDGRTGRIVGKFDPNQVIFEYFGSGKPSRNGLLVGSQYTILDTNVFHHFIFLARLFDYKSKDKAQSFEVVIPQERDSGYLRVRMLGKEDVEVAGRKISAFHLQVETGAVQIQLWVDSRRQLRRITLPNKNLEVVLSSVTGTEISP